MRDQLTKPVLLRTAVEKYRAVANQLRPIWIKRTHIQAAAENHARDLLSVIDEFKNLGFDHTADTNRDAFFGRVTMLAQQGLIGHFFQQLATLECVGVLDSLRYDPAVLRSTLRQCYDRFFIFWRKAVTALHGQNTFTFEDQKYWCWLDSRSPGPDGKPKPPVSGNARYAHVLVDEFQDIGPLDLALVRTIVERHRATLTIVGDDDQAIFEWRGATPEYILKPNEYFDKKFETHILAVNYRSPQNIVDHSQSLIRENKNRVQKEVTATANAPMAQIEIRRSDPIGSRIRLVSELAHGAPDGSVAVIGRLRGQLLPYLVYYASDGGPVRTATDLDPFAGSAFDNLVALLEIWGSRQQKQRQSRVIDDAVKVCDLIKKRPFSKKDDSNVRRYLRSLRSRTCAEALDAIGTYDGPPLSGRKHDYLARVGSEFVAASTASDAVALVGDQFTGLKFDYERAEDDVWYTNPPLAQVAEMAGSEGMSVGVLIDRLQAAKDRLQHWRGFEDDSESIVDDDRPLHLMTATRSKGKEFDTVVLLDCVEGVWPYRAAETTAETEAERRLFYVAFTRAKKRLVLLASEDAPLSPFIAELGLPPEVLAGE